MSRPKYLEYKDSEIEWLGDLPSHWRTIPLKRVASCNDSVLSEKTPENTLIEYVEISDVDSVLGITGSTAHPFSEAPSRARRRVRDQDVLVSTVRTYLKAITPVRNPPPNMVVSTGFAVIRPDFNHLTGGFLGYLFRSEWIISEIIARSVGVSYPAINASDIMQLSVPIPQQQEQVVISCFLDHETAKIDALIHEQQRLIELLQEKRQAVISHAVTKGLDPTVAMKDSGVEWLGEVPAHWVTGKLRWYATNQGGIAKGKDYANQATVTLPYLRVANVQAGYVNLNEVKEISVLEDEVKRYSLKPGDVLMNEGGDNDKLGRGTVWQGQISPCLHQNHVFAIRTNQNLLPEWLATFTQSQRARAYFFLNSKQSTNLASISSSNVMNCDVPIPPREEQQKTLQLIAAKSAQVNQLIDEAAKTVGLLGERRSALISAAVTGKIDVRNWQPPADESAFDEAEKQAGMETTA